MQRAIIKFKPDTELKSLNLKADLIISTSDFIELWNGDSRVGLFRPDIIDACYISEKKENLEGTNG